MSMAQWRWDSNSWWMAGNSLSAGKRENIEPDNARCRRLTLAGRIYTCARMVSTLQDTMEVSYNIAKKGGLKMRAFWSDERIWEAHSSAA